MRIISKFIGSKPCKIVVVPGYNKLAINCAFLEVVIQGQLLIQMKMKFYRKKSDLPFIIFYWFNFLDPCAWASCMKNIMFIQGCTGMQI